MNLSLPVLWWLAAGLLVAGELLTGTIYLLMLGLGCAAGAVAAHAGAGTSASIVVAAVTGTAATVGWHWRQLQRRRHQPDAQHDANLNLDIGQTVEVPAWDGQGRARCQYRGALWTVRYQGQTAPQPGPHTIVAVDGSELLVSRSAA